MLRFASLGSGSKGNGTLVENESACVLIDCGFSVSETERRLRRLDRSPSDLSAILVTHEHSDHIRGVAPLARKYQLPVKLTHGTAIAVNWQDERGVEKITPHKSVEVGSLSVLPIAVPHDAREPVQYVISSFGLKFGILTDLGSVTASIVEHYGNCDCLLLEANHDVEMLATGPYPPFLKRRVGSDWGHLNNGQTADLLSRIDGSKIQTLVIGHISQKNNHQSLVERAVVPFAERVGNVLYACQNQGVTWQTID